MDSLIQICNNVSERVIALSSCTGEIPKKIKNGIFIRRVRSAIFLCRQKRLLQIEQTFLLDLFGFS
jgi:hypothetical protein